MSQLRNTSPCGQRSLLRRLSYLSGVGVLNGGVAFAQAPPDVPQIIISSPSTSSVAPPVSNSASVLSTPERSAPESSQPESIPLQIETNSASEAYEAPSTIVFSDRASGCEFTLKQGQTVSSGACGGLAAKPRSSERSANDSRGGYLTKDESNVQASAAPIRVGVTPSSSGISVTQPSTSLPASGFVKDYYSRIRPLGIPGNGNVRLLFPLSIPSVITSVFGWRVHPITGDQRFHSGTDLGAPMGTPVLAALTGRVVLADFFGGYGLAIALEHAQGTQQTLYGHLSEIFVKPGDVVKQGTAIGRVGSTGNSTGPHLHFEFRQLTTEGWVAQDPGVQLESALAQLVQSLQTAQKTPVQPSNGKS